jgi:hypothetical protein
MKTKSLSLVALGLIALLSLSFQVQAAVSEGKTMTLKGDIIDNMCADGNKDNLADFVRAHSKSCALMPNCVASGYSLFVDGKLHKFDQESNQKIEEFLRKSDSKLQVVVTIEKTEDLISLVSIENH